MANEVHKTILTHCLMISRGVVFWDIVSNIICTWSPVNHELVLINPVSDPVESHIHFFATLLFHCAFKESNGCFIIKFHRSRWLWVARLCKGHSERKCFLSKRNGQPDRKSESSVELHYLVSELFCFPPRRKNLFFSQRHDPTYF